MSENKKTIERTARQRAQAKRQAQLFALQKNVTIVVLLILLVVGLISTTFASVMSVQKADNGSLIVDITNNVVAQNSKSDLADTKANVDVLNTSATITAGTKLYLNAKFWGTARFAAYFYNSDADNAWVSMTAVPGESNIYVCTSPNKSYAHVIFCRMNNGTTANNWNNKWNQTGNLDYDGTNNLFTITQWDNQTSGWSKFTPSEPETEPPTVAQPAFISGAPLYLNSTTCSVWASSDATTFAYFFNDSLNKNTTVKATAHTDCEDDCFVVTVPDGTWTGLVWVRMGPNATSINWNSKWGQTNDCFPTEGMDCYKLTSTNLNSNASGTWTLHPAPKSKVTLLKNVDDGGTVSADPTSAENGSTIKLTATPSTGYTFVKWTSNDVTITNATSATSASFAIGSADVTVKADFRPNTPTNLKLAANNVVQGTTGNGTDSNPYIVFEASGFTLTADCSVPTGASKYFATSSSGAYSSTKTFSPSLANKGVDQTYTIYAKSYVTDYYSTNSISSTAHYMVFSHLKAENVGFNISSQEITDLDSVTLSNPYVNGIADAENKYIEYTYQVKFGNEGYTNLTDTTWTPDPNKIGTYYFRVVATNTKTGETVNSTAKAVVVKESIVYYDIEVTNEGSISGVVELFGNGEKITNNKILRKQALTVSIKRPNNNYYIEYIKVDGVKKYEFVNGDIINFEANSRVMDNIKISYKILAKPKVNILKPDNASGIEFVYLIDGAEETVTTAGTYHVDYNSDISYAVTPNSGYYVSEMTGVDIGPITSSTVTGTKSAVKTDISESITATLVENNTFVVNIDKSSAVVEGATMTVQGQAHSFEVPIALNYGAETNVVITPPEGCYALVSGASVSANTGTDGKATFNVTLEGENKEFTVKFFINPKIYMAQPQYGSIYVTSDNDTEYYFNGDSVGYGTNLTVHVIPDHTSAELNNVFVNDSSIGNTDGLTFDIREDSTVSADITVDSRFVFSTNAEVGMRRIFFTDNDSWGNTHVSVHYSNVSGDTDFSKNSLVMTQGFKNDTDQYVYYADIPVDAEYVTFYNKSNTSKKTNQAKIESEYNAFWNDKGTLTKWRLLYSDFVASDRETTIQQGYTVKNEPAEFSYVSDYGDDFLTAEVIAGNPADITFDKGLLSITPTSNASVYTLVKVTSLSSHCVKYYLVKVDNFEICDFTGLQKVYSKEVMNNIDLKLILKGGVLNYAAKYFISDTNTSGSFMEIGASDNFVEDKTIQAYTNNFLIKYAIGKISGVKYFRAEATDSANHKATSKVQKTLFGTNNYEGKRVIYFNNQSNVNILKYKVRACFIDADSESKIFVTMQRVGETDYYRAVVPSGMDGGKVNFYLCNSKTFSNDYSNFDGDNDTVEFYSYGVFNASIPNIDDANIVFSVTAIDKNDGMTGSFTVIK